jgi:pilus assembly protein CpaF
MTDQSAAASDPIGRVPLAKTFGRRDPAFVDQRNREPAAAQNEPGNAERRHKPADNLIVFPSPVLDAAEELQAAATGVTAQDSLIALKRTARHALFDEMDLSAFADRSDDEMRAVVSEFIVHHLADQHISLSAAEQRRLTRLLVDDIIGYGPLEPLLADASVSDILVNGPNQVWIERGGKLDLSAVQFEDERHLRSLVDRILGTVQRRVDERTPLVDARLVDGSRVNVAIPPASYKFTSMSIRKFLQKHVTLDDLVKLGAMSFSMATLLKLAAKSRLNILISGGTGAGKTTLLQAVCQHAAVRERIITIEDTAELQLQQPDVVPMEARPPNIEGKGEITIADLLRNALRMRPDRIILGEVRGAEAADMLQAMNTGHDGSIGTVHANSARDALSRFEYMVCMSDHYQPGRVVRQQIVNALDLVVHVERMKDGIRRVMSITEVDGMENETMLTRDIALYTVERETEDGKLIGKFEMTDMRPRFFTRLQGSQLTGEEAELIHNFHGKPGN